MNPDPQNTPAAPQEETPVSSPAPDTFATPPTAPTPSPAVSPAVDPSPVSTAPPVVSPAPAPSAPLSQPSVAPQQGTSPSPSSELPAAPTEPIEPASNPFVQAPAQTSVAPGTPFGDPAQPAPPVPEPEVTPVAVPDASRKTATLALIFGGIGLAAWLLPIVGLPVTIIALVFAIKGVKGGQKYAKLALWLAIAGLVATLINAAAGAYFGYQSAQKNTSDNSQMSSETEALNTVPYPEASRAAFIDSCVANGGTETTCTCTLDEIEKQLTFEEFSAVDKEIAETGNVPDSYREIQDNAVAACTE